LKINKSDYIGKKCFYYTVIDIEKHNYKNRYELKCLCNCGNIFYLLPYMFNKPMYKSCGCFKKKAIIAFHTTHGGSKHPLYKEYSSMIARCYNPKHKNYNYYGGRGITVCKEWLDSPHNFYAWVDSIGGRPPKTTLDRIDNNKGYSPDNCRYISAYDQQRNVKSNLMITHNGITKCLTDWAKEYGINNETARSRYKKGYDFETIFSKEYLPNRGRFTKKST
jgi:hypothetical protein